VSGFRDNGEQGRLAAALLVALALGIAGTAGAAPATKPKPSPQPLWQSYPLKAPNLSSNVRTTTAAPPVRDRPMVISTPDPRDQPGFGSDPTWPLAVVGLAVLTLAAASAVVLVTRHRRPAAAGRRPHVAGMISALRERVVGGGRDWMSYVVGARATAAREAIRRARRRFRRRPYRAPEPESSSAPESTVKPAPPADPLPTIRSELQRARRDLTALSLLLVEGVDAADLRQAIARRLGAEAGAVTSGACVLLPGVLPKRARDLAVAALATIAAQDGGLEGAAVGLAGYPRHAWSSDALFRMARRALEQAASTGEAVCVARDEWVDELRAAEEEQRNERRAGRHGATKAQRPERAGRRS
jgi:hypothetical protein